MEMGKMRRRTREITSTEEIEQILMREKICHLAMSVEDQPYVIPMMYAYEAGTIYMHCAEIGTKLEMLARNEKVCVEVQSNTVDDLILNSGKPCDWGFSFESVVAFGTAEVIDDREQKIAAYTLLTEKNRPKSDAPWEAEFIEKKIVGSRLIKITIREMTGKRWNGVK
ncbi:MAG: pyridoxamine 5'-phosphate oxidase family protein [Anaerovoracaceae bacterium]